MDSLALGLVAAIAAFSLFRLLRRPAAPPRPQHAGSPVAAPAPQAPPSTAVAEPVDVEMVRARLAGHRRSTFLPITIAGDATSAVSKFSGVPYLPPGEAWPACGNCGRPMQLFVQLAAAELPAEARERIGAGHLLQFFYCTREEPHCESECDAYAPHARSTLLRLVRADGAIPQPSALAAEMFPPRRITGWTETDDYPNFEEADDLGVSLSDAESDVLCEAYPRDGEKLLGWPYWVQGVEYPDCRVCGTRMELLFQLDSERNLPYMFGDVGVGHVTQCPEHRAELAFGWACH